MCALSSADRVPGYEPVGQRFESSRARQKKDFGLQSGVFFLVCLTMRTSLKFCAERGILLVLRCGERTVRVTFPQNPVLNP